MSDGALDDSPGPQPEVAVAAPLTPASRWIRLRVALASIGDKMLSIAIFTAALVGLLLPPVFFLVSGLWNTVAYISGVWTLWHEITAWRIADMFTTLGAVDTSLRFAVAGVSYFALILSFIVLLAGLLGRRRQHIFLLPGVLLCAPIVVIFIFATTLSFSVLATRFHLAGWMQYLLISFVLVNALVLAALLLDLRPATRRRWLAHHRRRRETIIDEVDASPAPLPVVRFGPALSPLNTDPSGTLAQPAAVPVASSTDLSSEVDAMPVVLNIAEVVAEAPAEKPLALQAVETIAETPAVTEPAVIGSNTAP